MQSFHVAYFRPYPFQPGQKIHISEGPRRGDWEVVSVSDRTVKLRCPVSFKEFEWHRFCYYEEDRQVDQWPQPD